MIRKICLLLTVTPLLLILTVSCDQQPQTPAVPKEKGEKKGAGSADARFKDARSQMIDGQFTEAADALTTLAAEPKIRQPLYSWIQFHQGLALLLDGRSDDARTVFGRLDDNGPFTKSGPDAQIAAFLVKLAHELRAKEPTKPEAGKDYDKWSYEGIALLALALKDWNLDKFEEATALFRQFDSVSPEKMVDWADGPPDLEKLKAIAANFVNDYKEYDPANKALQAASTPEDQQAAVDAAKAARAKMKLTTKLSKSLDASIADIGPKVAAIMAEKSKASADEIAADEKAFGDAKQKRADMLAKFQFAEARAAIADPTLKTEKARDEQELLTKKTQWLANFKSQLIEDLNKKGYPKQIAKKSGEVLPGGVGKADDQQVLVRGGSGAVAVPWGDITPDSILVMAQSFILPDMPTELAAFRKWHLGVYASFAGKKKESLDLMNQAAELKPIYKDEIPNFEKATGPW